MADLFRNKYKISSSRLQTWNYANEGMYFITICTANKEHFFGEIITSSVERQCTASQYPKMDLSEIGKIAALEWYKTKELRPDMNIDLDAFIVMPNHIHGIIAIGANQYNSDKDASLGDVMYRVSTSKQNNFGSQSKNLASILRGYKSAITTFARKNNILFNWQTRFHDHIIRSLEEYEKISNYIYNNIANWQNDKFNNNP